MGCLVCGAELLTRDYGRGRKYTPKKYCSLRCTGLAAAKRVADKAEGTFVDRHGYLIHSGRMNNGSKYQQPVHRRIMEKILGRKLEKWETVHHKDGNRQNNDPANLELWASRHGRGQRVSDVEDIWSGMIPPYQNSENWNRSF